MPEKDGLLNACPLAVKRKCNVLHQSVNFVSHNFCQCSLTQIVVTATTDETCTPKAEGK